MKKIENTLSQTEMEADANAVAGRICRKIWGDNYDSKIKPNIFNNIKELVREKLS